MNRQIAHDALLFLQLNRVVLALFQLSNVEQDFLLQFVLVDQNILILVLVVRIISCFNRLHGKDAVDGLVKLREIDFHALLAAEHGDEVPEDFFFLIVVQHHCCFDFVQQVELFAELPYELLFDRETDLRMLIALDHV